MDSIRTAFGFGVSLLIDLHGCDTEMFTRATIERFMAEFCDHIGMVRHDLHFWDYDDPEAREAAADHLAGISAVQFIATSNITIHTLDKLGSVYIDAFTCNAAFDEATGHAGAVGFAKTFWRARRSDFNCFARGWK